MERSKKLWALVMMVLMLRDMWYCDCCLMNERNALLQLMSSFPFNSSSRGLDTADCCNWGKIVQCNPTTGKVNQLDLSSLRNSNSSGDWYLNASLFLPFQQLETLKLRRNNIAGCLDNEGFERLSTLSSLEWLDLSENRFNNSILQSLGGLSSLKYLSLRYNNFKKAINIQELDGLSKLEELDLSANEITEFVGSTDRRGPSNLSILHIDEITIEGRSMLFQTLGAFVHVKTLYLRWCNFKGILMGQGSNNVSQVKELYLVSSSIDENFFQILGATMSSLKLLSMPGVKLNGSLPSQGICQLKHLEKLDISSNNLSGNLPMCLANLSSLRVLDLSYNYFTGSISLSPLRSLISLKYLYLSYNLFQIPFSLTLFFNHSKLQFLYASGNTIYAETEDHNLTPMFQLKSLFLSGHGNGGVIPKFLYHQHNLQYVDLSHIKMKGEFPHWLLENNTKLENLYLTNNSLLGSLRLPNHPHMNLSRLSISKNGFSGYIPLEIGVYFPRLRWLQMSGNEFSNSIPSSFGNMSLLENLDLSNNSLSGAVPDALSNCTWLNMVDISDNLLSGKIPRWIRNMSSLETLVLSKNFFSGSLPSNFCSPFLLSEVYLSKNKLQGSFADAFFDCRSLIVLDLSYNNLTGRIPNSISMFSFFSFIILSHNNLEGEIPIQLCELKWMSLIDLSDNNLSGQILPCLKLESYSSGLPSQHPLELTIKNASYLFQARTLRYFSGIDLSCNNFSGEIPPEIGNLGTIQMLNLSHNNLIGLIPPTFSNLRQTESLDLSYNKLNGKIPPQLTQLYALEVFSVAHNNLSGKTPQRVAQFATFEVVSYEGNPFLCGEPLPKSCNSPTSPPTMPKTSTDEKEGNGFIDMDVFYVSFVVSYIIVLLGIGAVLYINPYWRRAWFYFVEQCLTKSYCFLVDNIPLLSMFGLS